MDFTIKSDHADLEPLADPAQRRARLIQALRQALAAEQTEDGRADQEPACWTPRQEMQELCAVLDSAKVKSLVLEFCATSLRDFELDLSALAAAGAEGVAMAREAAERLESEAPTEPRCYSGERDQAFWKREIGVHALDLIAGIVDPAIAALAALESHEMATTEMVDGTRRRRRMLALLEG